MTAPKLVLTALAAVAVSSTAAHARPRPAGHLGGRSFEANKTFGLGIELCEWTAFQHPAATGYAAYRDTIGDLGMDAAGALLGAAAVALRTTTR